jgi:hypothetical protein
MSIAAAVIVLFACLCLAPVATVLGCVGGLILGPIGAVIGALIGFGMDAS